MLNGESLRHAITRLQGALEISPVPDTYQIAISLEGAKPEGLAEIVNSVAETYTRQAKSEEFYGGDQRVRELVQDRTRMQGEIDTRQLRRSELAQELGVSTFTESYINPYDHLLVNAKEALADARRKRIDAEAQLAAVDDGQRSGGTSALNSLAMDMASRDPVLSSLEANLNTRRTLLLSTISGLAPDHPGRRAAEKEIAQLDQERERVYKGLLDSYSAMVLNQRKAESYKEAQVESKLNGEVEQQASRTSWFTRKYQEGMALGLEIDRARKRLDSIEDRINFFSLERRAPGFVRVFSKAQTPDIPVKGGRKKLLAMVLPLALIIGLFVPIGVDLLDPRLYSPADVEKVLGFAPMAWLLNKSEAGEIFAREQVLRLANRLGQEQETAGSRIFAFTSVKAGGGTTTIVSETAAALAHQGISCLAVEANAYRADPRYRDPQSRGLTVILNGQHALSEAIVTGKLDLPDHIPVGELVNDRSLPDIYNLAAILRQATENYNLVLVDLPPLLASVDAEFIARRADVVVLVVEATAVTRTELRRAARSLGRLQPNAVSAVLNRVSLDAVGGFARSALQEFLTGTTAPASRWLSPWLWK